MLNITIALILSSLTALAIISGFHFMLSIDGNKTHYVFYALGCWLASAVMILIINIIVCK